jgi:hypothetical protein
MRSSGYVVFLGVLRKAGWSRLTISSRLPGRMSGVRRYLRHLHEFQCGRKHRDEHDDGYRASRRELTPQNRSNRKPAHCQRDKSIASRSFAALGTRMGYGPGGRRTHDLLRRRRPDTIHDSDEMPEFPRKTRHSAGKRFFYSDPLSRMNGHPTDTPPSQFHSGADALATPTHTPFRKQIGRAAAGSRS